MSFDGFKKVGEVFVTMIVILACVVAWQISSNVYLRSFWMLFFVTSIVGIGAFLQRAIAPTPNQLVSIDFLQNNFANLHLESLIDSSRVYVDFGRQSLKDTVMRFSLGQDLMFSGYRFLTAVSNPDCSQVYFVAHGQIDGAVKLQHMWAPGLQMFLTPLGDFSFSDAMLTSPLLHLNSWLFVPTPKSWIPPKVLNPLFVSQEITASMAGNNVIQITPSYFSSSSTDENIEFERKLEFGFQFWRITRLNIPSENSPQSILRMFKDKLERRRGGIESQDFPSGITVTAHRHDSSHT
jgi:hypothetical protein